MSVLWSKFYGRCVSALSALLLVAGMLLFAHQAFAQASASVGGVVTDLTGAVVPEVTITIHNESTGVSQVSMSDKSGRYSIPNIAPGDYTISASRSGFATANQTNVTLTVGLSATFNFSLKPGSVSEQVTVQSEETQLQPSSAVLGNVIEKNTILTMPLAARNFSNLLTLTPGVSDVDTAQSATFHAIGTATLPSVNGQRNRSNMYYLDGAIDLGSFNGTYNYEPVLDDIQEFRVETHSDMAEFGGVPGGVVNLVSRSGTNHYHGTLWDFDRNGSIGTANGRFSTVPSNLRYNQFGVVVGGPVWIPKIYNGRSRTFFFFAYEGFRQGQIGTTYATTPTAAQLKGDFSALCTTFNSSGVCTNGTQLYDPYSTNPTTRVRTPFPYNNISSRLSNAAVTYASTIFPAPDPTIVALGLAGGQNIANNTKVSTNADNFSGRIDEAIGSHDLLYGRISHYYEPFIAAAGNPNEINSSSEQGWNDTIHEVHTFSPTLIAEGLFAYNYGLQLTNLLFTNAPSDFPQTLISAGFANAFLTGFAGPYPSLIPQLSITGYLGNNQKSYQGQGFSDNFEYAGSVTKVLGRHTIKAGIQFTTNNFQGPTAQAAETFAVGQTSNLLVAKNTGNALASFLVGVPSNVIRKNNDNVTHKGLTYALYAQDQFQVTNHLTMNYGVRYDLSRWPIYGTPGSGSNEFTGDWDQTNGQYYINATPTACSPTQFAPCIPGGALPANVQVTPFANRALHGTDFGDVSGRVGFAYQWHDKTTITGGYGRFYDVWGGVLQLAQNEAGNWPAVTSLQNTSANASTVTAPITDPFSQGSTTATTPATPFTNSGFFFNPKLKQPFSDQWNLNIQQGFGKATVLLLGYVAGAGRRLTEAGLANVATYPAAGPITARQPFPYMIPTSYNDSTSRSNYQSLQTSLRQTSGFGLSYLLSYTWSKSLDTCSGTFASEDCMIPNPYNLQSAKGVSGFDLPQIFTVSITYQLPYGYGRAHQFHSLLVNEALGGWNLSMITALRSGDPLTPTLSTDTANTGVGFVYPNVVANPIPLSGRGYSAWFTPGSLVAPPAYTFGNYTRNSLRGPAHVGGVDMSLFKTFTLYKETNLDLRADVFGILNHPIPGDPNVTVGAAAFGTITSATGSRTLQLAAKINF